MRTASICGKSIPIISHRTIIVGSGAAGLASADYLHSFGEKDIAIVTENMNCGTSRNAGSDKQTYYKLSISEDESDSVTEMANNLMSGKCVDGDLALCEAALSVRCFMHLVDLGVPFPCNEFGEYVGYKTDHDPRHRATSAGPYTSKMMTEALEQSVRQRQIPIYDHHQAIRILTHNGATAGLLCINTQKNTGSDTKTTPLYTVFLCDNIIYATGGPAGIYYDSVYPHGHHGSNGLAFEAGAAGRNLTEWQYGLASLNPRWNVSGTYMQSLPRFLSTDPDGNDKREFLLDYFPDKNQLLLNVFLKGYQWPLDIHKIDSGSSLIDVLVYLETKKNRRVFLDFTTDPCGGIDFGQLPEEARKYLSRTGACIDVPYNRLLHMNKPAADFYLNKGIDLSSTPLEIALCAQHNNGGLAIDNHWRTTLPGLFCVGEASCSHGVRRPGGSALNAGQVGALRAAKCIALSVDNHFRDETVSRETLHQIEEMIDLADSLPLSTKSNISACITGTQKLMSDIGAAFRNEAEMSSALIRIKNQLDSLAEICTVTGPCDLPSFFKYRDILISQLMYLHSMLDYIQADGKSRGSALYYRPDGIRPYDFLPETFTYSLEEENEPSLIQEIAYHDGEISVTWREPHPLPTRSEPFEDVWRDFRRREKC